MAEHPHPAIWACPNCGHLTVEECPNDNACPVCEINPATEEGDGWLIYVPQLEVVDALGDVRVAEMRERDARADRDTLAAAIDAHRDEIDKATLHGWERDRDVIDNDLYNTLYRMRHGADPATGNPGEAAKDSDVAVPSPGGEGRCGTCGSDNPRWMGKPGTPRYQLHPGTFPSGDSRCPDDFHDQGAIAPDHQPQGDPSEGGGDRGRCRCAEITRDPETHATPEDAYCPVHPKAPCCGDPDHRHSGDCSLYAPIERRARCLTTRT